MELEWSEEEESPERRSLEDVEDKVPEVCEDVKKDSPSLLHPLHCKPQLTIWMVSL